MKKIIYITLVLSLGFTNINGQENQTNQSEKVKLEIRPNSREYGAILRDNNHKRLDLKKDRARYLKKKAVIQKKRAAVRKNKNQIKRQQIIQRRQAIIQQRRNLRK